MPMFPQSPPLIPYGGFSPIRLEDGFRRSRAFPLPVCFDFISLSPGPTLSRGLVALAGNPLTVSLVRVCLPSHRPLAQRGLSFPHLQTLLRPDAPVCRTPFSLLSILAGLCPPALPVSPSLSCLHTRFTS